MEDDFFRSIGLWHFNKDGYLFSPNNLGENPPYLKDTLIPDLSFIVNEEYINWLLRENNNHQSNNFILVKVTLFSLMLLYKKINKEPWLLIDIYKGIYKDEYHSPLKEKVLKYMYENFGCVEKEEALLERELWIKVKTISNILCDKKFFNLIRKELITYLGDRKGVFQYAEEDDTGLINVIKNISKKYNPSKKD